MITIQATDTTITNLASSTGGAGNTCTLPATGGLLAPLVSPALTGTPTAPTPTAGDNSTKVATTAFAMGAGIGSNQTFSSQTRLAGITYTNSTGKPIFVNAGLSNTVNSTTYAYINEVLTFGSYAPAGNVGAISFLVPIGATYRINKDSGGSPSISSWTEVR